MNHLDRRSSEPAADGEKVGEYPGEVWFTVDPELDIRVKFIFTSDRLSVQVHPDDFYAQAHGHPCGKTEMWHVLRASPDAEIAFGLREPASKEQIRAAALSGKIVSLLEWIPAREGDTFFVPAGTIHAIGGGLSICEIQQPSDVTYRMYDYDRKPPRPLHLDDALAVAHLGPSDGRRHSVPLSDSRGLLAECKFFRTEKLKVHGTCQCGTITRPEMYIAVAGAGRIGAEPFQTGDAFLIPAPTSFEIESSDADFVVVGKP